MAGVLAGAALHKAVDLLLLNYLYRMEDEARFLSTENETEYCTDLVRVFVRHIGTLDTRRSSTEFVEHRCLYALHLIQISGFLQQPVELVFWIEAHRLSGFDVSVHLSMAELLHFSFADMSKFEF